MPQVLNRHVSKTPEGSVYVGRPTKWGNPFPIRGLHTREEAIEKYRAWIMADEQAELRAQAKAELKGKDLVCWCAPKPCHADILMEIANE